MRLLAAAACSVALAAALTIGVTWAPKKQSLPLDGSTNMRNELARALALADVPADAEATIAAAIAADSTSGSVNLVSWLRPGPWRFQRCRTEGVVRYLPMIWVPEGSRCEVGRPIKVKMVEGMRTWQTPKQPAWMILATTTLPEPISLDSVGMPGCHLELPLDNVVMLLPTATQVGYCRRINGAQTAGIVNATYDSVEFEWTPGPEHLGQRLYLQGAWGSPGFNERGILVTDAVELLVGAPR